MRYCARHGRTRRSDRYAELKSMRESAPPPIDLSDTADGAHKKPVICCPLNSCRSAPSGVLACTGDSELGDLDQSAYDEKLERLVALSSGLLHDLSADYSAADATDSP